MTPLLKAAAAARDKGLQVSKCPACGLREQNATGPCPICDGTGISPDVEDLSYAAAYGLSKRTKTLDDVICGLPDGSESRGIRLGFRVELHDGTKAGITSAMLRLIAHAGEPQ